MKKILMALCCTIFCSAWAFDENEWFRKNADWRSPETRQAEEQWLKPPATAYPFAETSMKTLNGIPWPHIEGRPLQMFTRAVMNYQFNGNPVERMFREHGIKVFMLDVDCAQLQEPPGSGFTVADTTFEKFMKSAESLIRTVPDAKIIIRFWMTNVPPDYVERFPEAVMMGEDGKSDWGRIYGAVGHSKRTNFMEEWRLYMGGLLVKFIEKAGKSPYAPHIAGFYLAAMNSGEWWYHKGQGDVGWDYSPGRKELFKHYLALKYGPDHVNVLKKRWNLNSAEQVYSLPSLEERNKYPIYPGSKVSEYNQILNLPITYAASYFARIIKAQTHGKSLVGMEIHAYLNIFKNNGTIFLNHLLRTPEIDFLGGPAPYNERHLGNYAIDRAALSSLQKHGKFWFSEEDIRTHTAYGTANGAVGEAPLTREGSLRIIRRQFAAGMLRGYPEYLMDFNINWFMDQKIFETVQECNRIFEVLTASNKLNRKCRIALVSDQESQLYGNYFANPTLIREKVFNRSGLDYDFHELEDFLAPGVADQYSLVFFLNLRALSETERTGIEKLKNNRRTLVFLHDPGAVDLSGNKHDNPEIISKLTGIKLAAAEKLLRGPLSWNGDRLPIEKNAPLRDDSQTGETKLWSQVSLSDAAAGYKTGNLLSRFYGDDDQAAILARNGEGKAVTLMRKYPDWTAFYSSACLLPVEIVRALAQYAGTPSCSDHPDVLFAAGDAVAIHAVSDGERTITMPNAGPVFELFSRKKVSEKPVFMYDFKFGETYLFVTGDVLADLEKKKKVQVEEIGQFRAANPSPDTAGGFYLWQRFKRPGEFFKQRGIVHTDRYGDFPLLISSPQVYLVADSRTESRNIVRSLHEGPEPERSRSTADFNRLKEPYKLPLQWEALASDKPFVYLEELGIGKGKSGLAAFYLTHPENRRVKVLFSCTDPMEIWLNGQRIQIPEAGLDVTLSGNCSLFMVKAANPDGYAGFSVKFYEPDTKMERGRTLPNNKAAKDLKTRLAPIGYTMRLEKQTSKVELASEWTNIQFADGVGEWIRPGSAVNRKRIDIDPDARYKLSAMIRGGEGTWFIGFTQFDAGGKPIATREVHFVEGTDTELVKPCSPRDTVLYVKNAEKWQKLPNGCVAFETDKNYHDLPNRNLSGNGVREIVQEGGVWVVSLSAPVGKSYPVGTAIREHCAWTQQNFVQSAAIPAEWKSFSGECKGVSTGYPQRYKWWSGAKSFSVLLLANLKNGNIQFKDIKLEKEIQVERSSYEK